MAARKTPAKKKAPAKKSAVKKSSAKKPSVKNPPVKGTKGENPFYNNSKEHLEETMREMINKGKAGRPCSYTEEIGAEICFRISEGESLNSIVRDDHMPNKSTVIRWAMFGKDEYHYSDPKVREKLAIFSDHYAYARMVQAENLIDECTNISDDGHNDFMEKTTKGGNDIVAFNHEHVQRSKLRVETRKWLGEIYLPKVQAIRNREIALATKQPLVLQFDKQDEDA